MVWPTFSSRLICASSASIFFSNSGSAFTADSMRGQDAAWDIKLSKETYKTSVNALPGVAWGIGMADHRPREADVEPPGMGLRRVCRPYTPSRTGASGTVLQSLL